MDGVGRSSPDYREDDTEQSLGGRGQRVYHMKRRGFQNIGQQTNEVKIHILEKWQAK